ncbi:MAG: hypothetical protein QOJ02_4266 [Acidobacteriota bacterium]|jgi:signal transduction histidine kinase|nr:hypothetical protein [Acidobacteriota bacterium]
MAESKQSKPKLKSKIPFRIHPRVFTSLGSELVTNEVVAIIELVKNSYDALATQVDVCLQQQEGTGELFIEIEDDGTGMNRSIIENVWCVVATPYRLEKPVATRGERTRRVSGAKGLGRLSAAKLGKRLELITKSTKESCWQVNLVWEELANADSLSACNVDLQECTDKNQLNHTGTIVRVYDLYSEWDESRMHDLREQLSRLVSPFEKVADFKIRLSLPGEEAEPLKITPPAFLNKPTYLIKGNVDGNGIVKCIYHYSSAIKDRTEKFKEKRWFPDNGETEKPRCGPFAFEIRAWDIDSDSIQEIARRFDLNKSTIRRDIRNYRGVSIYRDGILVLPKSDTAREWLGLDLRRVSKVGTRMSTSQLVGYAEITAAENPELKDTSDRERLVDNPASKDFIKLLQNVITILEDERSKDRQEAKHREPPFQDLFASLSTRTLVDNISLFALRGGEASEVLPLVEEYGAQVEDTVNKIERRLVYYSRLASLGVLSAMIVHEVRNHTTPISGLTRELRKLVEKGDSVALKVQEDLNIAEKSLRSLIRLADRFAPLASRTFRTKRRDSILEEIIQDCIASLAQDIKAKKINIEFKSSSTTKAAIDPGELTAVLFNLINNSVYWLTQVKDQSRIIKIRLSSRPKHSRVYVQVDDSGPGVRDGDEERIFWPGVTRKPEGIGMGLTVASEIVAQHGGRMHLIKPGFLGGASFGFDLPLSTE